MKKYEYYYMARYVDKENQWVIQLGEKVFKDSLLDGFLAELGERGWELVNVSTFIGSNLKNYGLIPLNLNTSFTQVFTNMEVYYFKREKIEEDTDQNLLEAKKLVASYLDGTAPEKFLKTYSSTSFSREKTLEKIKETFSDMKNMEIIENNIIFTLVKNTFVEKGVFKKTQEAIVEHYRLELDISDLKNITYKLKKKVFDQYAIHKTNTVSYESFNIEELQQIINEYN
jgi:hypothetical protein